MRIKAPPRSAGKLIKRLAYLKSLPLALDMLLTQFNHVSAGKLSAKIRAR